MGNNIFNLFSKKKKIGLALGGGAVYGAAHIGVLKVMEENNIKIDCISGTSSGAFIAALYAFNVEISKIEELVHELDWKGISALSLSQFAILSNEKFGEVVSNILGDVSIEDAAIKLAILATDITNGQKVVLKEGNLAEAVMASTCIPGLFKPVNIKNKTLVDGGVVENVPVSPLIEFGTDQIIAVDLNTGHYNTKPSNIIDVLLNSFHFMMKSTSDLLTDQAEIIIDPDLSDYNRYDVDQIDDLIEIGYQRAKEVLAHSQ